MFFVRRVLLLASLIHAVFSACSDLPKSLTFRNMCFDNAISCSQISTTLSGTFCLGGTFATVVPNFRCNTPITYGTIVSSSCTLHPATASCQSPAFTYNVATVSEVLLVGSAGADCFSPLSLAQTFYEVVTFRTGSVNGFSATSGVATAKSTASPLASPSGSSSASDSNNIVIPIIIATAAGVLLIIAGAVLYICLKKKKQKSVEISDPHSNSQHAPLISDQPHSPNPSISSYPPQAPQNNPNIQNTYSFIYPPYVSSTNISLPESPGGHGGVYNAPQVNTFGTYTSQSTANYYAPRTIADSTVTITGNHDSLYSQVHPQSTYGQPPTHQYSQHRPFRPNTTQPY
ncbi:hypothetical protein HK098_004395 [Nowakowskiella sp. JEL0407]|nr:hypothetical protein HK098_004395 [Nowakowskiella sp. JEL0407]